MTSSSFDIFSKIPETWSPQFTDELTLKVLNFWKFTSYCSLKPLWSGMGEVVPARTSPTLDPPSPPTVHQLSRLALKELRKSQGGFANLGWLWDTKLSWSGNHGFEPWWGWTLGCFVLSKSYFNQKLLCMTGHGGKWTWNTWILGSPGPKPFGHMLALKVKYILSGVSSDMCRLFYDIHSLIFRQSVINLVWSVYQSLLTLKVLVTTIDTQCEGMGDLGSARYEPALLPPCPTIRVLSYSK